jgi:exopolysaccharide biosynthesis polyprenyl glycosylphosphotransferase
MTSVAPADRDGRPSLALVRTSPRTVSSRRHRRTETAVIVGAGEVGQLVARKLLRHPEYGITPLGFVDNAPQRLRADVAGIPVLGPLEDLASIVRTHELDRVVVAFSARSDRDTLMHLRRLAGLAVRIDVVPRMFELIGPRAGLLDVESLTLVSVRPPRRSAMSRRAKRLLDIVLATIGLIVAAPLFAWAWWRIPRETEGPVFFRQTRLGKDMREFTMLKFRTMVADAGDSSHRAYIRRAMTGETDPDAGELHKLDREDVVTPTGRWLRQMSLDEVPQLLNVLRGTMSLVGPRPCLAYETEYFAQHHYRRFLVPPGITGLWQVTARAHASFREALEMDVAYVRDWSLALDLLLILQTPLAMLRQRRATV